MNRLKEHFNKVEEQISNLPVDINIKDFNKQREKILWNIHWSMLEFFSRIEKDETLNEDLTEKIITIQETTTQKIKEITNRNSKYELLYKRDEEKINIEKKLE
jgi:hypothetical protein